MLIKTDGKFGVEEFNKFMVETFKPAVLEFNGACGKSPESVNDVETAAKFIVNESKRVAEECEETIKAFKENAREERLDGVVDVYWTSIQLQNLLLSFREKFGVDELNIAMSELPYDDVLWFHLASSQADVAISVGQGNIFSGHLIANASIVIIENNKQKYTKNKDVADDWATKMTDGCYIQQNEFNGQTYYCIKRKSDDYIVKPYTYKAVDLKSLGGV